MIRSNAFLFVLGATLAVVATLHADLQNPNASDGWQIPEGAAAQIDPVPATPATLTKGKALFKSKCQRCHGVSGTGDGPDADPDHPPSDLTDGTRAARNPDGVMFYKIWNGRVRPKMPAFKTDVSSEDVWTVIQYIKTLRTPVASAGPHRAIPRPQ
jgi:mono/diheme cytochrome c family protein